MNIIEETIHELLPRPWKVNILETIIDENIKESEDYSSDYKTPNESQIHLNMSYLSDADANASVISNVHVNELELTSKF